MHTRESCRGCLCAFFSAAKMGLVEFGVGVIPGGGSRTSIANLFHKMM
jgi:enoyl-CoA hydratase/carnithine racemase